VRALPMKAYEVGLTNILPEDLSVVSAQEVPEGFDPRKASSGKRYRYLISNRRCHSPMRRRTHWELYAPLALPEMEQAARALVGRHDFSAFRAANCQAAHPVRELHRVEWARGEAQELILWVEGTAFLKQMVRAIVGTLVSVGRGKRPPQWVAQVLASKDRTLAGQTAPAQGLTLMEVFLDRGPVAAPPEEPDEE
jgi:tRNA pseudouridine38-40 synthase